MERKYLGEFEGVSIVDDLKPSTPVGGDKELKSNRKGKSPPSDQAVMEPK